MHSSKARYNQKIKVMPHIYSRASFFHSSMGVSFSIVPETLLYKFIIIISIRKKNAKVVNSESSARINASVMWMHF
jgi:hypothetical protein